ncbi:hypothetical protein [Novosphingobium sp. BW1]|uniref:hypothetical protein n=1 Tax=Novosphingobium sp. BW1 TaxID=2592621 RepID=UPI0011DEA24F|nr:hypothetical protein [Novosphingobium sp. BW1]TYC93027.1 hypothetical protein FMM79_03305 [Novosphingobium sp. BW1]
MTRPRPRPIPKRTGVQTFATRRRSTPRGGAAVGAVTVKLTFDASSFAPTEVLDGIREIVRDEMCTSPANRDLFLLAQLLPVHPSPKVCALTYDAVVNELGTPGAGYDPVTLFHAGQRLSAPLRERFDEAVARGVPAARAEGWL